VYKLGWFSTARGKGSRGLLKAVQDSITAGDLKAKIKFVFCSRDPGEAGATDVTLQMVRDYGIPLVTYSYRKFKARLGLTKPDAAGALPDWRLEYDREVMAHLKNFHPDLCVLAGYMLVVGPELCQKYNMINLHPAAPDGPKGTWQAVIWKLIADGDNTRETGAMMHLVTPELDRGPVVTYCRFPIRGKAFDKYWETIRGRSIEQVQKEEGENNLLFKTIREHGYIREIPLLATTIKAFSEGKVKITPDKKVIDSRGRLIEGYDLSREIDERVKGLLTI
jgi:folate-dependent phosphoribosylglycinamide formyltransferase PurN